MGGGQQKLTPAALATEDGSRSGGRQRKITSEVKLGNFLSRTKFDPTPNPARVTVQAEKLMDLFGQEAAEREAFECVVQ